MNNSWVFVVAAYILPAMIAFFGVFYTRYHIVKSEKFKWLNDQMLESSVDYLTTLDNELSKMTLYIDSIMREHQPLARTIREAVGSGESYEWLTGLLLIRNKHWKLRLTSPNQLGDNVVESYKIFKQLSEMLTKIPDDNITDEELNSQFESSFLLLAAHRNHVADRFHEHFYRHDISWYRRFAKSTN